MGADLLPPATPPQAVKTSALHDGIGVGVVSAAARKAGQGVGGKVLERKSGGLAGSGLVQVSESSAGAKPSHKKRAPSMSDSKRGLAAGY